MTENWTKSGVVTGGTMANLVLKWITQYTLRVKGQIKFVPED